MPKNGKRYYTIPEVLKKDEIERAMKPYDECEKTNEDFNQRCTNEIVGPIISRINGYTGVNNRAEFWVDCLEHHLRSV
jgi:hypothetical protein